MQKIPVITKEIKFRVRDPETKKVIAKMWLNSRGCWMHEYTPDSNAPPEMMVGSYIGAAPPGIHEQFTGLKDKNGVDIYEGDRILSQAYTDRPHSATKKSKRFIGVVEYKIGSGNIPRHRDYSAGWEVALESDRENFRYGSWGDFWDSEVIGSIHDPIEARKESEAESD